MTEHHENRARRMSEPVQVYLARSDRLRLERLAEQLDATKSDVLRKGLEALEREMTSPAAHPALRIVGLAAAYPRRKGPGYDVATEHDRFLSESEEASWRSAEPRRTGRRPKRGKRGRG
jgi:Arc/MetJ-type ribon-helix-helix transcriptional regulator